MLTTRWAIGGLVGLFAILLALCAMAIIKPFYIAHILVAALAGVFGIRFAKGRKFMPSGLMLGTGTQIVATEKNFSQGSIVQSGNPLDMAIQGRGFFQILMPDGTLSYTRDGSFQMNSQGQLVNASGYPVQPTITVPNGAQSITVGNDGTVTATLAGQASPTQIGSLQLADFVNPAGLQPLGNNLYQASAASGTPQTGTPGVNGLGTTVQGSLETSNVNVVEELVNMIETQRAYEMNSKAVSATDDMLKFIVNNT